MKLSTIQSFIYQAEQDGLVQRTFRRLDPDRQQAVIEAILNEIAETAPDQIRIQSIANRAGVAVGSLYQYFPDRAHLIEFSIRLCTLSWEEMFDTYSPILAAMPLREGLRAYIMGGIELSDTEREVVQFFGRAAYQGSEGSIKKVVETIARKMLTCTRSILEQAQLRGEVRPDIDLDATARSLNAFLIALGDSRLFPYLNNYYQLFGEDMPFERVLDAAIELIINGAR